jgi:protocatechuate 4,5-dioxygenase alpha chain
VDETYLPSEARKEELSRLRKEIASIPGTIVFDSEKSRAGYHLNMFCMELKTEENRAAFRADESSFLARYRLSEEQRQAVLDRDYNRMLALGGNIYFLGKLAAVDDHSFQQIAANMTGMQVEEFKMMMLAGGRAPEAAGAAERKEKHGG